MRRADEVNEDNERAKHIYLRQLVERGGRDPKTAGKAADIILGFERFTGFKSFKTFDDKQAVAYKERFLNTVSYRTGKPPATATYVGALNVLRAFFSWLVREPGYRKTINPNDVGYLTPPIKDARVANARREIAFPTLAQCLHAFESMPKLSPRNRRDKAFFAMLMLTAARTSAALSLQLKHVDLVENCIHQDAREVATKFSKTFRTDFFPVDSVYRNYFCAWVKELREIHLFGHADPLFPRITERFVSVNSSGDSPQLKRQFQSTDTNIRRVIKGAFVSHGMPAFSPHSFRKTNALMMGDFCETLEDQKAWSQNLGHESIRTTVDDYMLVSPRRQREIFRSFEPEKPQG